MADDTSCKKAGPQVVAAQLVMSEHRGESRTHIGFFLASFRRLRCAAGVEDDVSNNKTGTSENRGGAGRGQGRPKQREVDVRDTSKFPRLEGYFSQPKRRREAEQSGGAEQSEAETDTVESAKAQLGSLEPPDVAPAAQTCLLRKGGIISQAVASLRAGVSPELCMHAHVSVLIVGLTRLTNPDVICA